LEKWAANMARMGEKR